MAERLVSGGVQPEDADLSLRPRRLDDFVGQTQTKENLKIAIQAAKLRDESLDHAIIYGPPGLGKTTLANIIAAEMDVAIRVTSGPAVERAGDMAAILTSLQPSDVLFIDEIHRMPKTVEEYLYSAMEDFRIDVMIDQGPNARSVRLEIPPFTLIGATTRVGLLTAPLRSRFTLQTRLDYYDRDDLLKIVRRSCKLLDVEIDGKGAAEIAGRARGTPRIVNNLIHFTRDYAEQRAEGAINAKVAAEALELLAIDSNGLDEMDKRIIRCMGENHNGGPVGLSTIAVAVSEEENTIEEVHEPFLIQEGYLRRTPQGRVLTERGWAISGIDPPDATGQMNLI